MRSVPNDIIQSLLRHVPILIERINIPAHDTKLHNSIRLTKNNLKRLNIIENESKRNNKY